MEIKIKGKIQKGFGAASTLALPRQIPHFRKYLPDIDSYYIGSINLLLEKPLLIANPDIVTEPIEWIETHFERFGFLRIEFETVPKKANMPLKALLWIPYGSPHFPNPYYHEIIAPEVNLNNVQYCNIIIQKAVKEISSIVV